MMQSRQIILINITNEKSLQYVMTHNVASLIVICFDENNANLLRNRLR